MQPVEVAFHGAAAALLVVLTRRRAFPGRLFAGYVAAYAVARFGLESVRANPPIVGGLTYYQLLCVPLLALGLWTIARRNVAGTAARPAVTS